MMFLFILKLKLRHKLTFVNKVGTILKKKTQPIRNTFKIHPLILSVRYFKVQGSKISRRLLGALMPHGVLGMQEKFVVQERCSVSSFCSSKHKIIE